MNRTIQIPLIIAGLLALPMVGNAQTPRPSGPRMAKAEAAIDVHSTALREHSVQIALLEADVKDGKTKLAELSPKMREFCEVFMSADKTGTNAAEILNAATAAKGIGVPEKAITAAVYKGSPIQQCLENARSTQDQLFRRGTALIALQSKYGAGCVDAVVFAGATNTSNQNFIRTSCPRRIDRPVAEYNGTHTDWVERELVLAIRGDAGGGDDADPDDFVPPPKLECTTNSDCMSDDKVCNMGHCVAKPPPPSTPTPSSSSLRLVPRAEGLFVAGPENLKFLGGGGGASLEVDFVQYFATSLTVTGGGVGSVGGGPKGSALYTSYVLNPFIFKNESKTIGINVGYRIFQADGVNGLWIHGFNGGVGYNVQPWMRIQGEAFVGHGNHYRATPHGVAGGGIFSLNLTL